MLCKNERQHLRVYDIKHWVQINYKYCAQNEHVYT